MATALELVGLVKSHVRGDDERFYSLALQLAASEARKGHTGIAEQLKDLLDQSRSPRPRLVHSRGLLQEPTVRPELRDLLSVERPTVKLRNVHVSPELDQELKAIVHEQRQRARLSEHGLSPRRKLLLVGPPGTGKTLTASALAGELDLPLFTVLLHGVISKYLGESAGKLRMAFDAMTQARGVYLFDEFDALGGKRSAGNDVGEARRILNSFLQFLESDRSDAIIVATTNHEELLDRALFRRFDMILRYEVPVGSIIKTTIQSHLGKLAPRNIDWAVVQKAAEGLSQSDIVRAVEDAARTAVLKNETTLVVPDLVTSLKRRGEEAK